MTRRSKLVRLTAHSKTLGLLKGQIGFLNQEYKVILVAKDTGNLSQLAEEEGVEFRDVDMKREISVLDDLKSLWCLIKLFRKERPEIVHANTPKGALLGLLAAKMTRVPKRIYNVNGLRFETATGIFRRLLIFIEKITCACSTKIIPQSNGVADVLRREKITSKPLRLILNGSGNGVDTNYFDPDNEEVRKNGALIRASFSGVIFVFVGRIVRDKGVNELVEAFDMLSQEFKDVRLELVGPSEELLDPVKPETLNIINKNSRIFSYGRQKDVRPFLAASDVFVLPSYREGFPNVVLEALSMNLPCIVSDVNGATDAVQQHLTGLIIPKKDTHALYRAMRQLYLDSKLRMDMSTKTRPRVKAKFNRLDVWEATLEMYKSL